MIRTSDLRRYLQSNQACPEAIAWLDTLPQGAPAKRAWDECPLGGWLFWMFERLGISVHPRVRRAGLACACEALQYVEGTQWYDPVVECIEVAALWLDGLATDEELAAARDAAWAARAAARDAVWAVAWDARDDAWAAEDRKQADIIREVVPWRWVQGVLQEVM